MKISVVSIVELPDQMRAPVVIQPAFCPVFNHLCKFGDPIGVELASGVKAVDTVRYVELAF